MVMYSHGSIQTKEMYEDITIHKLLDSPIEYEVIHKHDRIILNPIWDFVTMFWQKGINGCSVTISVTYPSENWRINGE